MMEQFKIMDIGKYILDLFEKYFRRRALKREFNETKIHIYDEDLIWFINRLIIKRGKDIKSFEASRKGIKWTLKIN